MKSLFISLLVILLLSGSLLGTEVPGLINFHGYLSEADAAVTGTVEATFKIYDAPTGGNLLWSEIRSFDVLDGYYSIMLGEITPLEIDFNGDMFLALQITGQNEMAPRYMITATPFAWVARYADSSSAVADNSINETKIIDGSIPLGKLKQDGAAVGQTIKWDGSGWIPANDEAGTGGSAGGWTDEGDVIATTSSTDSVGIGTVTPGEKFCVIGSAMVSGKMKIGTNHTINSDNCSITGGDSSYVGGNFNHISGGQRNAIDTGYYHSVVGGYNNGITNTDTGAFIGGGLGNWVTADYGTIVSGRDNIASGIYDFIGGGYFNRSQSAKYSVIVGGLYNITQDTCATIVGGSGNNAAYPFTFIGGGKNNSVLASHGTVAGGELNSLPYGSNFGFIGGGYSNLVDSNYSVVVGGSQNAALGEYAFVGGGVIDTAYGQYSTVGGGWRNIAVADWTTVCGGYTNAAYGLYSTAVGGYYNIADSEQTFVGGGLYNYAGGFAATIGGGHLNVITGKYGTIGGGHENYAGGFCSTVPGGDSVQVSGDYSYAAGHNVWVNHDRSFVWNGSSSLFQSSDSSQFLINAPGGVGIGRNSIEAGHLLHVNGLAKFEVGGGSIALSTPLGWPGIIALTPSGNRRDISFRDDAMYIVAGTGTSTPNDAQGITITNNGNVGIKMTPSASYELDVGGNIRCVSLTQTSDERLKDNIETIDDAVENLMHIDGVRYDWKEDNATGQNFSDKRQIGLIAQEVEEVFPELVETDDAGYKAVDYSKMTAVLIQAIKELKLENDQLKKRLEKIENK